MKNLMDKLSKTVIFVIILLLFGMTNLKGDGKIAKTVEVTKQEAKVNKEIVVVAIPRPVEVAVIPRPTEQVTPDLVVKKGVVVSRGGYITIKKPTERELINAYVREITKKYNIEPELIMSVIQQESNYDPKATNGKCLGLMQVSSYWHQDRAERLGVTDFYDPYSNILLGVDYISELLTEYEDPRLVLMLYNMEHKTALRKYKNGEISNYATTILARAEELKKGE